MSLFCDHDAPGRLTAREREEGVKRALWARIASPSGYGHCPLMGGSDQVSLPWLEIERTSSEGHWNRIFAVNGEMREMLALGVLSSVEADSVALDAGLFEQARKRLNDEKVHRADAQASKKERDALRVAEEVEISKQEQEKANLMKSGWYARLKKA